MDHTPASRFVELLDRLGYKTQQQIADLLDIARPTAGTIVRKEKDPSFASVAKLKQEHPEVNIDWVFSGSGKPLLTPVDQLPAQVPSKLEPYREGLPTPGEATPQQADFVGRLIERLERELSEARVREAWYQEMLKKPLASHDAAGFMFAEPATPISMRPTACQPAECVVRPMWGPAEVDVQKAA